MIVDAVAIHALQAAVHNHADAILVQVHAQHLAVQYATHAHNQAHHATLATANLVCELVL